MVCYIVSFPEDIDYNLLSDLGIIIIDNTMACINCVVADLDQWQLQTLLNQGCKITYDATCRVGR